jgi:hypothetical protein
MHQIVKADEHLVHDTLVKMYQCMRWEWHASKLSGKKTVDPGQHWQLPLFSKMTRAHTIVTCLDCSVHETEQTEHITFSLIQKGVSIHVRAEIQSFSS